MAGCSHSQNATNTERVQLTVFHTNGLHLCNIVTRCCPGCTSMSKVELLLRHRLWPATVTSPETAVTLDALETFQKLSLQGKINTYDFVKTLLQKTDNTTEKQADVSDDAGTHAAAERKDTGLAAHIHQVHKAVPLHKSPEEVRLWQRKPWPAQPRVWWMCHQVSSMSSTGDQPSTWLGETNRETVSNLHAEHQTC